MKTSVTFALVAVVVVIVGSLILRAATRETEISPVASTVNGAPRGLLALSRLGGTVDRALVVRARHDRELPDADVFVVPPPESAALTKAEARLLLARAETGARVVVLCDDDDARNARLASLTAFLGVHCASDDGVRDAAIREAVVLPGLPFATLAHRGAGSLKIDDDVIALPLALDDKERPVVVEHPVGRGVVVLMLASLLANDGLALADNAALALYVLDGARVVVDEAHHVPRRQEVWRSAFLARGPIAGALALALLIVSAFFSFLPRAGDAPRAPDPLRALTAEDAARASAALYATARAFSPPKGSP